LLAPPLSNEQIIVDRWETVDNRWEFWFHPTTGLQFQRDKGGANNWQIMQGNTTGWSVNTWHHVAVTRVGNTYRLFLDGTKVKEQTASIPDYVVSSDLVIGKHRDYPSAPRYLQGYIDELRISKGIARWTDDFTPNTTYYGGHVLRPTGNLKLKSDIKKFGSSSAYFDGSSYFTSQNHSDWYFGSGDFTIDCWVRYTSTSNNDNIACQQGSTDKAWSFGRRNTGNAIRFVYTTNGSTEIQVERTWTPSTGVWYHVAAVRSGSDLMLFVDGNQIGSTYNIGSDVIYNSSEVLSIGGNPGGGIGDNFPGHIDEFRISRYARWTSNFTPPTEEYETDSHTKLLLHFSGDMSDSAHQLTFESSDNAISVSPTKWNGSFYFDGNDRVVAPYSTDWAMFNDDFTIDVWVWLNSDSGHRGIIGQHVAADDFWGLYIQNDGYLVLHGMYDNVNKFSYGANVGLETERWYHLAVVRDGSTCRMFVDGVAQTVETWTSWQTMTDLPTDLKIGRYRTSDYFIGFMDELRVSKGIARWTSNFTLGIEPYSPNYISGNINFDGRIIVFRETDWSIVHNETHTSGSYIASGLGSDTVTAVFRKSDGDSQGYGNITLN
jgi:hypothetical protein